MPGISAGVAFLWTGCLVVNECTRLRDVKGESCIKQALLHRRAVLGGLRIFESATIVLISKFLKGSV